MTKDKAACVLQLTQYMSPEETMEVSSGECRPPYRCHACVNRRQERMADPEHKGKSYKTNTCDRPNNTARMSAGEWMRGEVARINKVHGRTAEMLREVSVDGVVLDRFAVFVNAPTLSV